jgi:hypothetical protein
MMAVRHPVAVVLELHIGVLDEIDGDTFEEVGVCVGEYFMI